MKKISSILIVLAYYTFSACFLSVFAQEQTNDQKQSTVLTARHMIDVSSGKVINDPKILIQDGIITAINPSAIPKDAKIVNLGDRYLVPGLIDMHVHLSFDVDENFKMNMVTRDPVLTAYQAAQNAKITLMAGYTTVRDCGVYMYGEDSVPVNVGISKAIAEGLVPGPTVVPAGHFITSTGGHGDITGFAPGVRELDYRSGVADGIDELKKAVRYQIKHGARVIKFMATGGVISEEGGVPQTPQFSQEEINAICNTAHSVGIKCAAHAEAKLGAHMAIAAGVDTLEHGFEIDDSDLDLMKEKNIVLVPTALTASLTELYIPIDEMPENITHKADLEKNNAIKTLKKAIKRHIYIASGSDAGIAIHGTNAKELHYYVEYGMTPLEALQSATIKAANALSSYELDGKKIGQLKPGYAADVIALKNNPLEQIDNLQTIDFVMKGGTIYKSPMGRC